MVLSLSAPEILGCYFDDRFEPRLPAMRLRWSEAEQCEGANLWELPEGILLAGPPPDHFGIQIHRSGGDAYAVRLLWNRTYLNWSDLSRGQLLTSTLAPLLSALGSDLYTLLDQPIHEARRVPRRAA